jgi:thioredoxin-like negative regulator of GroEL
MHRDRARSNTSRRLLVAVATALVGLLVLAGCGASPQVTSPARDGGLPVMYEFYTDWWPSCIEVKPVVDGLKAQYAGKVDFKLYDVDKSAEGAQLADEYGAQYVPTFVFLNADGTVSEQLVGALSEEQLTAALDKLK